MRIEAHRDWLELRLREVWDYRELLYFFIWRDVKVRYRQTVIGVAWVVLQPLLAMGVFTSIFWHAWPNFHPRDCRTRYFISRRLCPGRTLLRP